MKTVQKNQVTLWMVMVAGASLGLVASFIQTIERIQFAKDPVGSLSCDINNVFSCSSVFDAWQSSVFGFSNSIMCLAFFALVLGIALVGATGSVVHKVLRFIFQGLSVFFLFFGAWYLQQSAFVIGALCIFCIFCYIGVIALNWAWVRININDYPISDERKLAAQRIIAKGGDTFFWIVWGLVIALMFVLKFVNAT